MLKKIRTCIPNGGAQFHKRTGKKDKWFSWPSSGWESWHSNKLVFSTMSLDECVLKNHSECIHPWSNMIPYFCGHSNLCMTRNETALHYAKLNVRNKYAAVGLVEDMESSLRLFENVLPDYFSNSTQFYQSKGFIRFGVMLKMNGPNFELIDNESRKVWNQNFMTIPKRQKNQVRSEVKVTVKKSI